MRARGGLLRGLAAGLCALPSLPTAVAHITFKLPSLPGVSPGNAGGYGASVSALRGGWSRATAAGVRA